jgi:hypothetical protein
MDTPAVAATETPATDASAAPETAAEEVVTETPAEAETPAVEQTPEEKAAADAAAAEAAKAAPTEIPEDVLAKAAQQFANKTMAAARRAEARIETVKSENTKLSGENKMYADFVQELRTNPFAAIRKLGFPSVKAFLDSGIAAGGEPAEPTADDRVAALERQIRERDAQSSASAAAARVEASKTAVFGVVDKDTARFDLAATEVGHGMLWDAIVAYHELHGNVPDEAVFALADEVEKDLEAKFAKTRKLSGQRQTEHKTGASAAAGAASAASKSGKTLSNKQTSGASAVREYSLDPEVRRKQVNEDLRKEGLL